MNLSEPIVGNVTEVYQTVHMKELTDLSEDDPTEVFTDIHFWGRSESESVAHELEAYDLSYGLPYQ